MCVCDNFAQLVWLPLFPHVTAQGSVYEPILSDRVRFSSTWPSLGCFGAMTTFGPHCNFSFKRNLAPRQNGSGPQNQIGSFNLNRFLGVQSRVVPEHGRFRRDESARSGRSSDPGPVSGADPWRRGETQGLALGGPSLESLRLLPLSFRAVHPSVTCREHDETDTRS